jgi:ribonuclease HI
MEKIKIYVDGKTYNKLGSGFAVIMKSMNNVWKRSFAYGKYSANHAEMLAIRFSLLSIAEFAKNYEIDLYIKGKYMRDMLEKENGSYTRIARVNQDLMDEIRSFYDSMNITIYKSEGEDAEECAALIENAVKNNDLTDIRQ